MITTVIFDFDGVIVDSVDIKGEAFCHLFRDQPEDIRRRISDLHANHAGMTRYEKFKIICEDFLERAATTAELERLSDEFSRFCVQKIIDVAYIPGAFEFISKHCSDYDLYVASSAPEIELKEIIQRRGLADFFKGTYGTPRKKVEICRAILQDHRLLPEQVAFIGDSISDYEVAQHCGTHFIGRVDENSKDLLSKQPLKIKLCDLSSLNNVLRYQCNGGSEL
jgi:phosphoglycolate phosphatase-like HAD superfamily hydrolase